MDSRGVILDDEAIEVYGDEEVIVSDVANEVIIDEICDYSLHKNKRQYAAATLRTNEYLRPRPRQHVPPGRTPFSKYDEEDEPPRLSDPDGSYATPSMKPLFRMYSDATLKKADAFFQVGASTSQDAIPSESGRDDCNANDAQAESVEDMGEVIESSEIIPSEHHEVAEDNGKMEEILFEGAVEYDLTELGCPLYSEQAIDFPEACDILLGNVRLSEDKICKTTPHEYKGIGTFVVDWSAFLNRQYIGFDGCGSWGKPSGRTRFYRMNAESEKYDCVSDARGQMPKGTAYDVKCQLKKYHHPTTALVNSGANRFIKKIITCISKEQEWSRLAVITYDWIGTPFDFAYMPPDNRRLSRGCPPPPPPGTRTWEAASFQASGLGSFPSTCTAMMGDCMLYSMGAIQFQDVCNIIIGATLVDANKICDRIPQRFRECGTFIIDMDALASEHEMRRDDNGQWGKPAGNSRYFKINAETQVATRLDRCGKLLPGQAYDLQVLCKRYEHPLTGNRFVRKIYTGRVPINKEYHQTSTLSVITYFWKGEPVPFDYVPQRKVRVHNASDYELLKRGGGVMFEDELGEDIMDVEESSGMDNGAVGGAAVGEQGLYLEEVEEEESLRMVDGRVRQGEIEGGGRAPREASVDDALPAVKRKKTEGLPLATERTDITTTGNPSEEELQYAKMTLLNQQRFSMLLERFESMAERMERMMECQMNIMWSGNRRYVEREQRGDHFEVEGEEEVYEEIDG